MAGLLDNDLMSFLVAPRAFMARRDARADAREFAGLLGTLQQQGPTQPGAGLLASRAPDQAFWLKAAQIPGFQDMASQQLGIDAQMGGALARQQQQQQWEGSNLTAAQREAGQLARDRFGWDQQIDTGNLALNELRSRASAASSYASAANSDASRQLTGLNYLDKARDWVNKTQGTLYEQLGATDKLKANDTLSLATGRATAAADVVDWLENRATGSHLRGIGTGYAPAMDAEWNLAVLPAMKDMLGAGALDEGERKFMQELIGAPGDVLSNEGSRNKLKLIAQKVQDERARQFGNYGLQAPALPRGQSAISRVLSQGQPAGKVIDWKGGDAKPSIWFPDEKSGAGTYRLGR